MSDNGQIPTPVSPQASSSASASVSTTAASAPAAAAAASSTSAPHAPFPTAMELMGPPGGPATPPSGPSASEPPASIPAASLSEKIPAPTSAEQLLQLVAGTPRERIHLLVPTLDNLAGGGTLAPGLKTHGGNSGSGQPKARPSPLLYRLDPAGLDDDTVRAGSLGFLYSMTAMLNVPPELQRPDLLDSTARFCMIADVYQLTLVPSRLMDFAWSFLRYAQQLNRVDVALAPLRELFNITVQPPFFNPVHAVFLEACLYTRQFAAGWNTLSNTYIDALEGTSYLDVLTYHYHAGTLCAAVGAHRRATQFFNFAVAMPTTSFSAIQLACAKRAILCELLSTGRQVDFPKDTGTVVSRNLEKTLNEYHALAKAFANRDWKVARDAAAAGGAAFSDDCNLGLVQQIIGSITKRRVLNLRATYSRMTVTDLARKVEASEEEVVAVVQAMIAARDIRATITPSADGPGSIVTLLDDDDYASPENMAKLKQAQALATWLQMELERGNARIGLNKKWLTKQAQYIANKEKGRTPDVPSRKGTFDAGDDIGPAPLRGVGSNLADMGF